MDLYCFLSLLPFLLDRERLEAEQGQGERVEQQAQFEECFVGLRKEMEMKLVVKEETRGKDMG